MGTYSCKKCQRDLPLSNEYYFSDRKRKLGHESTCKECRGYRFTDNTKLITSKKCNSCGIEKENNLSNFYTVSNSLRTLCKICRKEKDRLYKVNNRKKILESKKVYRTENKDKIKRYRVRYLATNEGKMRRVIATQRRRAIKRNTINSLTVDQWEDCLDYFNQSCAYCGECEDKLQQDHFHPLNKGGDYSVDNIVPACSSCNPSKGDKLFSEWYRNNNIYSEQRETRVLGYIENKQKDLSSSI